VSSKPGAGQSANRGQLNKISQMMEIVTQFNRDSEQQARAITAYLGMVNRFLGDSGKAIFFDDSGLLSFRIEGLAEPQSVTSLSSGEAQIFVILTHLAFNPTAQEANVFIVDEPELSLHVQWQELFVQSVQSANPNVQYIMATHAPSIILDRSDRCRDLSKTVG
jgi:predicted ATPase